MSTDTLQTIGKYLIAAAVIVGAFIIIGVDANRGVTGDAQPWSAIALIVGWIVRDSAGQSATTNAVKLVAAGNPAQPAGPPVQ